MVIDFSKLDLSQRPKFIVKNLDGTAIGYLGHVLNPTGKLYYNEVSEVSFEYPSQVNGEKLDEYDLLTGMRIIDVQGYGLFLLRNPTEIDNGIVKKKKCTAYSLEHELTHKYVTLEEGTYNFWNPLTPESTILGIITNEAKSWTIGDVSEDLIGKYRTFSVDSQNIYDWMKSDLQETYGCIFDFDTYNRTINVRSVNDTVNTKPVYLSLNNLVKELEIEENTDEMVTALDVYGADDVTIRSCNPMGTNRIYNLDAYMNDKYFSDTIIEKWNRWKTTFNSYQKTYYQTVVARNMQISRYTTEEGVLGDLQGELSALESQLSVTIQKQGVEDSSDGKKKVQSEIDTININIASKNSEISAQKALLNTIQGDIDNMTAELKEINQKTAFSAFFTDEEMEILDRYFKCDSLTDSTFVASSVDAYATDVVTRKNIEAIFNISNSSITKVYFGNTEMAQIEAQLQAISDSGNVNLLKRPLVKGSQMIAAGWNDDDLGPDDTCTVYSVTISTETEMVAMNFTPIRADENGNLIEILSPDEMTAYGESVVNSYHGGEIDDPLKLKMGSTFLGGECINNAVEQAILVHELHEKYFLSDEEPDEITFYSIKGGIIGENSSVVSLNSNIVSGTLQTNTDGSFILSLYLNAGTLNGDGFSSGTFSMTGDYSSVISTDTSLQFKISNAAMYMTQEVTEYQKMSVEYELFEYGEETLDRLSSPTYYFTVSSANFFALDDFIDFAKQYRLGERIYLHTSSGVLSPIATGVEISFDDPTDLTLSFGNTYSLKDASFNFEDLLAESVSMGTTLDLNQYNYSNFVTSGAKTQVKDFMTSAIDTMKNRILSGNNEQITIDELGIRCRKYDEASGIYEPKQIWIAHNAMMFTKDNWATAEIGIGEFYDKNLGNIFGIVAPAIVGTILAGSSLVIESEKQDGGIAVFKMDAEGCSLHNASFNLYGSSGGRIDMGAIFGIVGGTDQKNMFNYDSNGQPVGVKIDNDTSITRISQIDSYGEPPYVNFWIDMYGSAFFKGKILADSGVVGGWTIAEDFLYAGTGTSRVTLNASTKDNSLYAFWCGATKPENAPFWVKKSGDFYAQNGKFKGTVQGVTYLDDSGNQMMNSDYEFTSDYLDLYGITIRNKSTNGISFQVDETGKVTINGKVTMGSGSSIDWSKVSESNLAYNDAYSLADEAYDYADDAYYLADSAYDLADSITIPSYIKSTYIDSTTVKSPTINGGTITGTNIYFGADQTYGHLYRTYGNDGNKNTNVVEMYSNAGIVINATDGLRLEASGLWINLNYNSIHVKDNGSWINLETLIKKFIPSSS